MINVGLPDGIVQNSDFRTIYSEDNFIADTVLCPDGEHTTFWRFKVPDGQGAQMGFGSLRGQENAEGRFFAALKNSLDADVTTGYLILAVENQQGREVETLLEAPIRVCGRGATVIEHRMVFQAMEPFLRPKRSFIIKYVNNTGAAVTLKKAGSLIEIAGTKWDYSHV